ncbi:MAG: GNAT family N-acetyltransferase [candidate division SR1 bacterium]|nr:GNAT family N-acetyltransferase [candidate division SR1 bacterium]
MQLSLPQGLHIDKKISLLEYKKMKLFMEKHDVGRYKIKQKDFYRIREGKKIIAFGRLFKIGFQERELGSLWVDESHRGQKLGLILAQELIADKRGNNDIFLATRKPLEHYYKQLGFEIIIKDIPQKLIYTIKRAIENGIDFIIMKLAK